jgi:hypothetical protein
MNSFVLDIFERIARECVKLVDINDKMHLEVKKFKYQLV